MFGLKRLYIYTRDKITCLIACYNKFIIDSDGLILCLYFQITFYNAGRPEWQPCLCWYIFHFESSIVRPNFLIEFPAHNFIHLLYREPEFKKDFEETQQKCRDFAVAVLNGGVHVLLSKFYPNFIRILSRFKNRSQG